MSTPKHRRRTKKLVSQAFRTVAKDSKARADAVHRNWGRRYRATVNLPLGQNPKVGNTPYRIPGMKPLLHNGGKP